MAGLGQKIIQAFQDQERCDVRITFPDGSFVEAHRLVLILGSEYFKTLLNENWSVGKVFEITCADFDPGLTRDIITDLYKRVEICLENVKEILQAADFYIIPGLKERCVDFLMSSISCENVFMILKMSFVFHVPSVLTAALSYVDDNFENIMSIRGNSDLFCTFPTDLLILLIKRDTICIHEEKPFRYIYTWVLHEDRQTSWKTLVPYIRFGRMSIDFFIENVVYKNILENDYAMKIILFLTSLTTKSNVIGNVYLSRKCISTNDIVVDRFHVRSPHNTWESDLLNGDRLSFSVHSDMKFKGVVLFGAKNCSLLVNITLTSDACMLKSKILEDLTDVCEFPVIFPNTSQSRKDVIYTIAVNICGDNVFFGIDGLQSVQTLVDVNIRVKVKFFDSVGSKTNVCRGQIKSVILCKEYTTFSDL